MIVVETTQDDCKSCLKYISEIEWTIEDEADFRSFTQWNGLFDSLPPQDLSELYALLGATAESIADILLDKFGNANFKFKMHWSENESGCCP